MAADGVEAGKILLQCEWYAAEPRQAESQEGSMECRRERKADLETQVKIVVQVAEGKWCSKRHGYNSHGRQACRLETNAGRQEAYIRGAGAEEAAYRYGLRVQG